MDNNVQIKHKMTGKEEPNIFVCDMKGAFVKYAG